MAKKIKPRVYSYIRFSTPEQELGDSERRQLDLAEAWAKRKGLDLDTSLKPDRGKSGYHGAHRKSGHLGIFLASVEAGEVPRGSILLVENVDRLSREGVTTTLRKIIFALWDHGITLVTLSPEDTYDPDSANSPKFLALLLYMQMARDESAKKSMRIRSARDRERANAREGGGKRHKMCPGWLRLKDDRSGYEVIKPAAQTIKRIFEEKSKGKGSDAIAKLLNATAPWTPHDNPVRPKVRGQGWRASYIKKILSNPAVIGVYQPYVKRDGKRSPVGEAIQGYYPAVVPAPLYHAVQDKLAANRGKGGRTGRVHNLLPHLAKCAYCGGPMAFVDKGKTTKGGNYLVCDNGRRGVRLDGVAKCHGYHVRYNEVEEMLLDNCEKLRPEVVLPH